MTNTIANDETKLFARIREHLYTAVIHDVLDDHGYASQALPATLRPLREDDIIVGRAATLRAMEVEDPSDKMPFGFSLQFLESLQEGEVVVGTAPENHSVSLWGEIMSTAAKANGAEGVIFNGFGRDAAFIKDLGFPAFFNGLTPTGSVGRLEVREVRVDIEIGGVVVHPGDLIMADYDGIIVIPQEVEKKVLDEAFGKVEAETKVRAELREGASIVAMYEKYGVL